MANQQLKQNPSKIRLFNGPNISILVPAWNESKMISACIESFASITYPNKELIVIAGGADGTYEIANKYAKKDVIVLKQEPPGKNAALNKGLKHATGEIIALTDADCIMNDKWFKFLIKPILNGKEEVVSGENEPLSTQLTNPFVLYQYTFTLSGRTRIHQNRDYLDGKTAALRKEALEAIGGFDEKALTGTDFSLKYELLKKGYTIKYVTDSIINTNYPNSFREYIKQRSRWLRNFIIYGRKYGDKKNVGVFLEQTTLGVIMLTLPIMAIKFRFFIYVWLILFCLGIYNRWKLIKSSKKAMPNLDFGAVYLGLPIYALVNYMAWAYTLLEYLLPWRRRKW